MAVLVLLLSVLFTGASAEQKGTSSPLHDIRELQPEHKFSCPNECGQDEFCGRDLMCHRYSSCEEWYKYGHPTFTGYDPDSSENLTCNDIPAGQADVSFLGERSWCVGNSMPIVAQYGCSKTLTSSCPEYDDDSQNIARVARMNRKCTAQPAAKTGFVCYDISPTTDFETYFAPYLESTATLESNVCANETMKHFYTGLTRFPETRFLYSSSSSETFNYTAARGSLLSDLFKIRTKNYGYPICTGCKDTEFCGRDLQCHEYSCENVYQHAPYQFTGYDEDDSSPPPLSCFDTDPVNEVCGYQDKVPVWPAAVQYRCLPEGTYYDPSRCPLSALGNRYLPYNRYCNAMPHPDRTFECFDISPETSIVSFFEGYLNRTRKNPECTLDNLEQHGSIFFTNQTLVGRHDYNVCIDWSNRSHTYTDCLHLRRLPSGNLNIDLAQFALRSIVLDDGISETSSSKTTIFSRLHLAASLLVSLGVTIFLR